MTEEQPLPDVGVVVGVDGSKSSLAAVDWAARTAAVTNRTLTLCLVLPDGGPPETELYSRGEHVLARAATRAVSLNPALQTRMDIRTGHAAAELIRLSEMAELLVVGSHGAGWFHRILLGSTTTQVTAHARCTVVVTRMQPPRGVAQVLVGVDGAAQSQAALEFGFAIASREGIRLLALHAFSLPPVLGDNGLGLLREPSAAGRAAATAVLDEALAPWRSKYPDVDVRRAIVRGSASRCLLEASIRSSLVVVGSRGRGGFSGLLLGSVSQHVVALANCPVAITHASNHVG